MLHHFLDLLKNLTDSAWINSHGGLYIVMFIIFAETGLFVGFFLPGDSLLFITGMIIANSLSPFDNVTLNLIYWIFLITLAGVLGNLTGYWFGRESGHLWFEKRDTWLFKRKHLVQAHDFYEKRGGTAIILARFLPIVRTFAPIIGGVVTMNFKKFFSYSIIGCLAWVVSMVMAGYLLGKNVWVKNNLEKIVILLILITTLPVLFRMFFGKKKLEPNKGQSSN
ncbi:MAG TPA: VTT domain-containing protein [Flavipsychrobacter sp.]|nr:VTT domain-containing protein [Flavipsychrobacter sp.]